MNPSASNPTGAGTPSSNVSKKRNHKSHGVRREPYICVLCDRSFSIQRHFYGHSCRFFRLPHPCQQCGKRLDEKQLFQCHFKNGRVYECKDCWDLNRTDELMSGMRIGEKETVYKCKECGKQILQASLRKKRFQCKDCGNLNRTAELMSGMKIHAEETVYNCKECGKSFTTKQNLNNHGKTHPEKGGNLQTPTVTQSGETAVGQSNMDIGQI